MTPSTEGYNEIQQVDKYEVNSENTYMVYQDDSVYRFGFRLVVACDAFLLCGRLRTFLNPLILQSSSRNCRLGQ